MSPRPTIIALQGAAVAALVIVVYVVLLRPDGANEITGIEAPEGAPPPTQVESRDDRAGGGDRRDRRHRDTRGPAGPVGDITAAAGPSPPPGIAGTQPASPADDQYADAARLLLKRVRGGVLPGE